MHQARALCSLGDPRAAGAQTAAALPLALASEHAALVAEAELTAVECALASRALASWAGEPSLEVARARLESAARGFEACGLLVDAGHVRAVLASVPEVAG